MSQLEKAPLASGPTQNWLPWGCLVSNLGQCSRIWSELSPGYKDPHPALHLIIHHEGARPELRLNFKADLRHAPVALPDPRNPMEAPHAHDLESLPPTFQCMCIVSRCPGIYRLLLTSHSYQHCKFNTVDRGEMSAD